MTNHAKLSKHNCLHNNGFLVRINNGWNILFKITKERKNSKSITFKF